MTPRFSIVVPTRDRPQFLSWCLESLAAQTFGDVEVVVSDNAVHVPAREVFERWNRPGWRYVAPERPVAMHDNFEFGVSHATGDHVAVLIDKTVLLPSALETAARALDEEAVDVITWWNEGYDPVAEAVDPGRGTYLPLWTPTEVARYDGRAELETRFAFAAPRASAGVHYFRGKIVFGSFSRALVTRIRDVTGRVFHPLAPDYTSMVPALVLADGAVDLGRSLVLSYNSASSNGFLQTVDPGHARRFIEATDPEIIDTLPIPGLYTSLHNVVAHDLVTSAARCGRDDVPIVDRTNLLRRAREDLAAVHWSDDSVRDDQYRILEAAEHAAGITPSAEIAAPRSAKGVLASVLARSGPIDRLVHRALGRPQRRTFTSPVAAARAADRRYPA